MSPESRTQDRDFLSGEVTVPTELLELMVFYPNNLLCVSSQERQNWYSDIKLMKKAMVGFLKDIKHMTRGVSGM